MNRPCACGAKAAVGVGPHSKVEEMVSVRRLRSGRAAAGFSLSVRAWARRDGFDISAVVERLFSQIVDRATEARNIAASA